MNKKYVPLKKLMKEKYLEERKKLGDQYRLNPPTKIPIGFQIPFGPAGVGGIVPTLPDIIDFGEWLIKQRGNQSGDNPIVLPGVPQGGGGVHGQQPTNPNY